MATATQQSALFEVPFSSAMSDHDSALLGRMLDLSSRMNPKLGPRHESPGLARLDHSSGLFLNRGADEGTWVLQARTWGHPTAASVHGWHVLAADAAHQLDATVVLPERREVTTPEIADQPLGRAANRRFAQVRRRLAGVR